MSRCAICARKIRAFRAEQAELKAAYGEDIR